MESGRFTKKHKMRHGSLFSGIGGFDLAAEWMGWENVFHCEWMPFPRKILEYYWPKAISYEDITKTDFTIHRGTIDILTGGFPCQPYSSAGKRLGKEDERHLWPHMRRAIREIEPTWVVGENVRGLTNWNGGVVFEEVCADLEACGYEVQPVLLPACAVGTPHRRDRIWFVAYSNGSMLRSNEHRSLRCEDGKNKSQRIQGIYDAIKPNGNSRTATDSDCDGLNECNGKYEINSSERGLNALNDIDENDGQGYASDSKAKRSPGYTERKKETYPINGEPCSDGNVADTCSRRVEGYGRKSKRKQLQTAEFNENNSQQFARMDWEKFPTQSPICSGDDGLSTELDGITFSKWRNESIKGYGNAVVPQLVLSIFKTIEKINNETSQRNP